MSRFHTLRQAEHRFIILLLAGLCRTLTACHGAQCCPNIGETVLPGKTEYDSRTNKYRLTDAEGRDDGSKYSPDSKQFAFISYRLIKKEK